MNSKRTIERQLKKHLQKMQESTEWLKNWKDSKLELENRKNKMEQRLKS